MIDVPDTDSYMRKSIYLYNYAPFYNYSIAVIMQWHNNTEALYLTVHGPLSPVWHGNRYQLMLICWSSEPEARLNFTQLKYFFKSVITADNTGATYIKIEP